MPRLVLLLLLLTATTLVAQTPAKPAGAAPIQVPLGWQRWSHPVGKFSVLVPGEVTTKPPTSDKAGTYYTFTATQGSRSYVIAYNDSTYDMTEPQIELNSNRDSFIGSLKATIVSEHRFYSNQPVGQVPATEFTCESAEYECRSRTFIMARRGYQVAVLTRRGAVTSLDVDRFLDSFTILAAR
jgi:hypothetical protein